MKPSPQLLPFIQAFLDGKTVWTRLGHIADWQRIEKLADFDNLPCGIDLQIHDAHQNPDYVNARYELRLLDKILNQIHEPLPYRFHEPVDVANDPDWKAKAIPPFLAPKP